MVVVGLGVAPFITSVIPDVIFDQKCRQVDAFRNDP